MEPGKVFAPAFIYYFLAPSSKWTTIEDEEDVVEALTNDANDFITERLNAPDVDDASDDDLPVYG